jgi:hypothetical protein
MSNYYSRMGFTIDKYVANEQYHVTLLISYNQYDSATLIPPRCNSWYAMKHEMCSMLS